MELGWSEVYMSRRLRGKVPFNVADLDSIARLLDVPVTTFFESPSPLGKAIFGDLDDAAARRVNSDEEVRKSAKPDYLRAAA